MTTLRSRIVLLNEALTPDEGGGGARAFTPSRELFAEVTRLTAVRDFGDDRLAYRRRIAAVIREGAGPMLGQRLGFEEAIYEVIGVETDAGRARRLRVIGEERAP